jgi:hypothetical protein
MTVRNELLYGLSLFWHWQYFPSVSYPYTVSSVYFSTKVGYFLIKLNGLFPVWACSGLFAHFNVKDINNHVNGARELSKVISEHSPN